MIDSYLYNGVISIINGALAHILGLF